MVKGRPRSRDIPVTMTRDAADFGVLEATPQANERVVRAGHQASFESDDDFLTCPPEALLPLMNSLFEALSFRSLPRRWDDGQWEELEEVAARGLLMNLLRFSWAYELERRSPAAARPLVDGWLSGLPAPRRFFTNVDDALCYDPDGNDRRRNRSRGIGAPLTDATSNAAWS